MVIVRICLSAHLFCHSPSSSFTHTPFLCELCSVFLKNLSKSFIYCLRANRHIVSKSFALIELKWPFNHKCLWICLNRPKLDVWPAPCQLSVHDCDDDSLVVAVNCPCAPLHGLNPLHFHKHTTARARRALGTGNITMVWSLQSDNALHPPFLSIASQLTG